MGVKVEFPPLRPAAFGLREAWVTPPVAVAWVTMRLSAACPPATLPPLSGS